MIIFGAGEFAQVANDCFPNVEGFAVSLNKWNDRMLLGKEIWPICQITEKTEIYVAIGDNKKREEIMLDVSKRGFVPCSFVSGRAHVDRGSYGKHCFIMEGNNVQSFASIGNNVVCWATNHIGHHSRIGNHCFITSHVCIGGGAEIGDYTFVGMNATIFDHVKIGAHCIIAAGAVVDRDIPDGHTLSRKGVLVANS